MVFHMKTANVRELRLNFPRLLDWLQAGEEIQITRHRNIAARLVPEFSTTPPKRTKPGFAARLAKRDPDGGLRARLTPNI